MTAWEELTKNSSIVSGTAWDHLFAQEGGGDGKTIYVEVIDTYVVESAHSAAIEIEVAESSLADDALQANINDEVNSILLQKIGLISELTEIAMELSLLDVNLSAVLLEETI